MKSDAKTLGRWTPVNKLMDRVAHPKVNLSKLSRELDNSVEILNTSIGDEVACISLENVRGILEKELNVIMPKSEII